MPVNNIFVPTWALETAYDLTPEMCQAHGIKAVLTDLDNTLIAWNNPHTTEILTEWVALFEQANIPIIVISNNTNKRVGKVANYHKLSYIPNSLKPSPIGFKRALSKVDLPKDQLVMIGDQIFTDVLGANLFGIRTILVKRLVDHDSYITRFNRMMERKLVKSMLENKQLEWSNTLDK